MCSGLLMRFKCTCMLCSTCGKGGGPTLFMQGSRAGARQTARKSGGALAMPPPAPAQPALQHRRRPARQVWLASGPHPPGGLAAKGSHVTNQLVDGGALEGVARALCSRRSTQRSSPGGRSSSGERRMQAVAPRRALQRSIQQVNPARPPDASEPTGAQGAGAALWHGHGHVRPTCAAHRSSGCGRPWPPLGRCRQTAQSPAALQEDR